MRSVLASPYATHQREPVCLPQVPTHLEERDYRGPSPRIQHFLSIWHGPAPALPLLRKGDLRLIHGGRWGRGMDGKAGEALTVRSARCGSGWG
jgi:hypothetical protein